MSVCTSETLKQGNSSLVPQKRRRKKQTNKQNFIICEVLVLISYKTVYDPYQIGLY